MTNAQIRRRQQKRQICDLHSSAFGVDSDGSFELKVKTSFPAECVFLINRPGYQFIESYRDKWDSSLTSCIGTDTSLIENTPNCATSFEAEQMTEPFFFMFNGWISSGDIWSLHAHQKPPIQELDCGFDEWPRVINSILDTSDDQLFETLAMCRTASADFEWFVTTSTLSAFLVVSLTAALIIYCCIKEGKADAVSQAQLLQTREPPGEEHVGAHRERGPPSRQTEQSSRVCRTTCSSLAEKTS
jgi:hypothetical protein